MCGLIRISLVAAAASTVRVQCTVLLSTLVIVCTCVTCGVFEDCKGLRISYCMYYYIILISNVLVLVLVSKAKYLALISL